MIATLRLHQASFIINQSKLASNLILMVNWVWAKNGGVLPLGLNVR